MKIERRRIRGETSNGMLCSPDELGLGTEHDGIMALSVNVPPGTPFLQAMPIGDVRYDLDVLPNRPDLLSHVGVAREVSALTGVSMVDPLETHTAATPPMPTPVHDAVSASSGGVTVRVEDHEGCPRYTAAVIRGVTVRPSPEWLVQRLESVGLRAINSIVDVTNYLLYGYGQPMHAFDLARLTGSAVVVRRARPGEKITTLDRIERALDASMTVIADAERAIAVAGIMGGRASEVTVSTTDVLLEVAYFTPRNVRHTRLALGLSTDASYRFERGIDAIATPDMLARAVAMILDVAGGRIDGAPIDVGAPPRRDGRVTLRPARVERLLGDRVSAAEITRLLTSVGFAVAATPDAALDVASPTWRNDVSVEADLVEEVARLRGYDTLPDEVRPFRPGNAPDHPLHLTGRRVRDALVGAGLMEVRPMPFVRGTDETHVRVQNPLADDEPHLRRSLLETLARRAEYNLSRMQGNVRIFEIGSTFSPRGDALPDEELRIGALIMGDRRPPHFTEPRPPRFDVWDAKALGERIAELAFPHEEVSMIPGSTGALWMIRRASEGNEIGAIRAVSLDAPPWAAPAFGVEVTLGAMPNASVAPPGSHRHTPDAGRLRAGSAVLYRPLPGTPAAQFDLALLLPDGMSASQVERVLRATAGDLLEELTIFDEYRGDELPAGHRSVAWTLTFRDPSRTLRDKEIEGRRQKILKSLESELGVRPRTA
jgi:phenylalanyl-tRNA synthetase beta chain